MRNNGLQFVFSFILAVVCIKIVVTELCPYQSNVQDVHFCVDSTAEFKQSINIGNEKAPQYANNNCTCTITALDFLGQIVVNLKEIPDAVNISFVRQDGSGTVISRDSSILINITGDVHVIYQSAYLDTIEPICLKLQVASNGAFSVSCQRPRRFNDRNTPISSPSTYRTDTSPTITHTTSTTQPSSLANDITQNKDENAVILGPVIGGICGIIAITISAIVIVVIIRRRKHNTTRDSVRHIEGETAGNNAYDDLDHQNSTNNVNTEYRHIANRSGEVNASYENTGDVNASYENTDI